MRQAEDFRPTAHPGSLVGDYAETEAQRRFVLNGNGIYEDHPRDTEGDSQETGWITF